MTEVLAAIAKFLSVGWRAGAAVAISAGLVWLLRVYDVPPVRDLPPDSYQYVVLAGLLGLGVVAVQAGVLLCQGVAFAVRAVWQLVAKVSEGRVRRNEALENLKCASRHEVYCLLWLQANDWQRFKAYPYPLLGLLHEAHLIEKHSGSAEGTHWRVPDYIWSALDKTELAQTGVPVLGKGRPPWETFGRSIP